MSSKDEIMPWSRLILRIALSLALGPVAVFAVQENFESRLASAAANFHSGDFKAAITAVDAALKLEPGSVEALELKALIIKAAGNLPEAREAFKVALAQATKSRWPADKLAPIRFELGAIDLGLKAFGSASESFQFARRAGFNVPASEFFLAVILLRKNRMADADAAFSKLLEKLTEEESSLRAACLYYRARIALNLGNTDVALTFLREARESATLDKEDALSAQILELAGEALTEADKVHIAAGVETLTEYDSNAILLSQTASGGQPPETVKQNLLVAAAAGWDQGSNAWAASFRSLVNYNFNKQTKSGEFIANELDGSWYFTRMAGARLGLGASVLDVFRNQTPDSGESFHNYLVSTMVGPQLEFADRFDRYGFEAMVGRSNFLDDPDMDDDMKRSGLTTRALVSWQRDAGIGMWNPFARGEWLKHNSQGTEFRGAHYKILFGDKLNVRRWQISVQAAGTWSVYSARATESRRDVFLALEAVASRQLTRDLAVILRLSGAENRSTEEELYSYRRQIAGAGIRYVF